MFSWIWHIGIMLGILSICVTLVILVPDIREIFGFVGATASSMLMFILPSVFYLKIMEGKKIIIIIIIIILIIIIII